LCKYQCKKRKIFLVTGCTYICIWVNSIPTVQMKRSNSEERECLYLMTDLHILLNIVEKSRTNLFFIHLHIYIDRKERTRTFALFSIPMSLIRNIRKKTPKNFRSVRHCWEEYSLGKRYERLNDDETARLIYYSSTCFNQTYYSNWFLKFTEF
jgi:hypothetical protein